MAEIANVVAAGVSSAIAISNEVESAVSSLSETKKHAENLNKNHEKLNEAVAALHARKVDLQNKINEDKTKQRTRQCKMWFDSAYKIVKEAETLGHKYRKCRTGKLKFRRRSELSKSMLEKHDAIEKLLKDVPTELLTYRSRPVVSNEMPKIEDKPSLHRVFQQILKFLKEKDVRKIGLWGIVGVGKTAIMLNLKESKEIAKLFHRVIFVTVTEGGNVEKLQREIAQQLSLNVQGIVDMKKIASEISKELRGKKYLLLLDDVCENIEFSQIGIRENENECKVVVASRLFATCQCIGVDDFIELKSLSDDDALKLFSEVLGKKVGPPFKSIVQQIIRVCGNLPLLIDRVARTFKEMRGEESDQWGIKLKELKSYPYVDNPPMDEVYHLLEFCFYELSDDERFCFQYGALYSESRQVCKDYLIECWRAEGLVGDAGEVTARDRGKLILHRLIRLSLLERSEKTKRITMNKVIRKMALKISFESTKSKCLVEVGKGLERAPDEEKWESREWISLMDNKLSTLPKKPNCKNLSTLLIQRNAALMVIPKTFFGSMENLRVLDLHDTSISLLPSSMACLKSLRALYLNSCKNLKELPSDMKALELLEILDIQGSGIKALPLEIVNLKELRSLRFSLVNGGPREKKVYHKFIQKLTLLEELVVDVFPEGQHWREIVKDISKDVTTSTKLTYSIGQYKLRYKILDYSEYEICRCLKYADCEGTDFGIPEVLAETEVFELIGYKGNLAALSDLGVNNINKIRSCLIESCTEIKMVINGNGITEPVLKCLEKMYLYNNLQLAEFISEGPVPGGSFAQLRTLVINKCSKLKMIFPSNLVQHLSQLEHLEVEACDLIEEISMKFDNRILASPELEMLVLIDLPILVRVCLNQPPSSKRRIDNCPLLLNPSSMATNSQIYCINTSKVAGWSLIEAQGGVHRFVAGDREQGRSLEIHRMLKTIETRVAEAGYVPNISSVLHDIGEEAKEKAIKVHNLRISRDCYELSKMISKAFEREIIMRDVSRFHHLKGEMFIS